jgi:hypothetical protein
VRAPLAGHSDSVVYAPSSRWSVTRGSAMIPFWTPKSQASNQRFSVTL